MVTGQSKNNSSDLMISEVAGYQWTWPEARVAISDLIFGPFDFIFAEMFGAKQRNIPKKGPQAQLRIVKRSAAPRRSEQKITKVTSALTKSLKPQQTTDAFQPQPSIVALRSFDLTNDDDVWVERYIDKKNNRISYYRSYRTGKCVLSEPPSGARAIVYRNDLEKAPPAIQIFAVEKLDRRSMMDLTKQLRTAHKDETRNH